MKIDNQTLMPLAVIKSVCLLSERIVWYKPVKYGFLIELIRASLNVNLEIWSTRELNLFEDLNPLISQPWFFSNIMIGTPQRLFKAILVSIFKNR